MLRIENLVVNYGGIRALKGISFEVGQNEIVTLIGANGAGKTTTMKSISGLISPNAGKIFFEDKEITRTTPKYRVKQGMILTPEGRQIFNKFTVKENLLMGAYLQNKSVVPDTMEEVFTLFPILKERLNQVAGTLSGGELQMLAIGRSLMSKPRLLMLDEPSMGLAPLIVKQIFELISRIRDLGCTILLVEQNATMALKISDRAYVLETGQIILSGTAADVAKSEDVKKAYLGGI